MSATKLLDVRPAQWEEVQGWLSRWENLLFVLLIVVHLIPLWVFPYFPSQDGPAHIYNASVLREYHVLDHSIFREYYLLNQKLSPNWFSHLIMAGLMYIVPPLVAEKILVSGYVILLPLSMRYALRVIRPDAGVFAFLAFPFIYNYTLHKGFYNFSYSQPMFFFVVGYWLKYQNRFTLRRILTLSLLSLLLYFCHLFSLVTAYIMIAVLTIWLTVLDYTQHSSQQPPNLGVLSRAFFRRSLVSACAFLPTLILAVMFLSQKAATSSDNFSWSFPGKRYLFNLVLNLLSLQSIVTFEKLELLFSTALVILFVGVGLHLLRSKVVNRQLNFWDGFLLTAVVYVVIYLFGPSGMAGSETIKGRLLSYPFFALILWFGAQSHTRFLKQRVQIVAMVISLILLGMHTMKYAELNNDLKEYVSGMDLIEPNKTLLPISFANSFGSMPFDWYLSPEVKPFCHASKHISMQKHLVDLANYEANQFYFPTLFRPQLNPYIHMGVRDDCNDFPPPVNFLAYSQRTPGKVDYVLFWRRDGKFLDDPNTKSIFRQLKQGYELIYTSPQRGFMQLYRRKD